MDLGEFPDIDIDQLLDTSTSALEDGFLAPYKQMAMPKVNGSRAREKRSRLAERIAQGDELIRKVKQLQIQNKQLTDLQRTAQEVTDLYQKEKQQRLELQKQNQQQAERCSDLEKQLDAQVINCEALQEKLQSRALPVYANEVLGILMQLEQRLGDDTGLCRRDQNIMKKLREHCKTANISLPTPKSPTPRNKRRSQTTQTDAEPVPEKPTQCSVAVQVENLIATRDQGTQHKNTTTTRGTTTASFIRKHDVGTTFPEPKPKPNVRQILDEMLSWRPAPLRPLSPLADLLPRELEVIPATVSVATCTTLCNIHREIDFIAELQPHIKVSASRPPSRNMFDSVKEEARSSRELAKELLNFLPQNQSCLANLPPQAFDELWHVFGQMVQALLQRRPTPPSVSQADFTNWLYELYEDTQGQPEQSCSRSGGKKDFAGGTECMDMGTDPMIASPNISHGGDVTPIRLPAKPREHRKRKSKKRKAAAALIKPIAKRTCQDLAHAEEQQSTRGSEKLGHEQEPETAIQFLSNLNTFNMANCDNLDMELDEEEMYLLQLTSRPTEQQRAKEEGLTQLPSLSLKDVRELEHRKNTEKTENPLGKTCKEAEIQTEEPEHLGSLPVFLIEEVDPSDQSLLESYTCIELENQSEEKANLTSLPELSLEETYPSEPSCSSPCNELEHLGSLPDLSLEEIEPSDLSLELKSQKKEKESVTNLLEHLGSLPDLSLEDVEPSDLSLINRSASHELENQKEKKESVTSLLKHHGSLPDLSLEDIEPSDLSLINSSASHELENQKEKEESITSLLGLSPKENNPSEPSCRSPCFELEKKPEERASVTSLPDISLTPPDTPHHGSDSDKETSQSEEQFPDEEMASNWNSFKELSVDQKFPALPEAAEETDKYSYSSYTDSDSEENTIESVKRTILDNNPCQSPKNKANVSANTKQSMSYLFGSDSDMDSEASEEQLSKEHHMFQEKAKLSPIASEEEFNESEYGSSAEQPPKGETSSLETFESKEELSENEHKTSEQQMAKEEIKLSPITSEDDFSDSDSAARKQQLSKVNNEMDLIESEEEFLGLEDYSHGSMESVINEEQHTNSRTRNEQKEKPERKSETLKEDKFNSPLDPADLVPTKPPSLPLLSGDSNSCLEKNLEQLPTQLSSPSPNSSEESDDEDKLVIDIAPPSEPESEEPTPSVTAKRRRTLSEIKIPPTPGEGRLTRQRAKQLLSEQNASTESRIPLVEQIRRQLKQAMRTSEPLKKICNLPAPAPAQKTKKPENPQPKPSYTYMEESPASPPSEPIEDVVDFITEIPLEQAVDLQDDGQPKSILQHVVDQYKGDPKLTKLRRKTLGKSQQQLGAAIGKYLQENMELEALSLEVYKLTKDEAVIVSAMIVVITKMGTAEGPLERLLNALKYFDFTQRFLAELEERLFRNAKERPPTELAMQYVKLYLGTVSLQATLSQGYTNPARLLLAKLLYHYDMPDAVLEVLRQFPTVLPHREERAYDHSDPLITVIKHLLMSRTYNMQDPDGAERLLLSMLRFKYHFQPFEPTKQQVLENLVEKLKAGRNLEQLGYAFALFCRRSPHIKSVELVVTEHLMPLAISYCDLAAQNESHDDRLVVLLQCISMVLKPLALDTDISAFVGLVKRLIVAVPRPGVQQAAVQACLRLQRFGFQIIRDALQNYRPNYPLDPLSRAMIRCFAERRKQYHVIASKGTKARAARK